MDKGNFKTDEEIKREEFEKYSEYNIKKYTMASKLQEAAKEFISNQHYVNPHFEDACMEGIEFGYNHSKEVIEELVKALEKMCLYHEKQATWDKGDNGYYNAKRLTQQIRNNEKQG